MLRQLGRNIVQRVYQSNSYGTSKKIALLSDLHWDNPKCNREVLKRDLNRAREQEARVVINGDFFCLMQGKYDPRRSKSDIRPEHNVARYLDAIVEDAAEWFSPYADLIDFIGYGNHETSIIRHQETDVLRRFIDLLNYKNKTEVCAGGYGGWYVSTFDSKGTSRLSHRLHYFHGSGGGGPVTKGTIQNNRRSAMIDGADCIWMGHVHEDYELTYIKQRLTGNLKLKQIEELHVRTPTYKEEYEDGHGGFHVERGAAPKPIGGRFLELTPIIDKNKNNEVRILQRTFKIQQK
jgi:hypothetical protein